MKVLYNTTTGHIHYAVYDKDVFAFTHTTNVPLTEKVIDELDPLNKAICLDLYRTQGKTNEQGQGKYYVSNGDIVERANWMEAYYG